MSLASSSPAGVVRHAFDPSLPTQEQVLLSCCGITFRLGKISSVLPRLEGDVLLVPEPYLMQVRRSGGTEGRGAGRHGG